MGQQDPVPGFEAGIGIYLDDVYLNRPQAAVLDIYDVERIEVLRDDGLPVRVIFDKVPPNLRARPTLSVTVDAASAGTIPARLSYLTPNLGWTADYVALFDEVLKGFQVLDFTGIQFRTFNVDKARSTGFEVESQAR